MWTTIFGLTNVVALVAWAILILLPRKPFAMASVLYLGIGLLCLTYVVVLVVLAIGAVDPIRDAGAPPVDLGDYSVAGIKSLFRSDGAIVLGWTHYLAFDLFVGLWIARDADAKGFSRIVQAPILLATFLAGPVGLFAWLTIRERRARALGRWE